MIEAEGVSTMKRSGKRIFCACLLFGIALAPAVGLTSALSAGSAQGSVLRARLSLRAEPAVTEVRSCGVVTVERLPNALELTEDGGWVDYTLVSGTTRLREVVRRTGAQEILTCTFEAVPYGEYTLEENGVAQCRVTVDERTPEIAVSLP